MFDDGRLKTASYDASEGFGLRAVNGETAGYAHSTEISEAALTRAAETARLAVGAGGGTLAEAPARTNRKLYTDADPMADASFPVKVETLREIDAYARDEGPARGAGLGHRRRRACRRCISCAPTARWSPTRGRWRGVNVERDRRTGRAARIGRPRRRRARRARPG